MAGPRPSQPAPQVTTAKLTIAAALAACLLAAPAAAQDSCLTADPPPVTAAPKPLRFGVTPGAAGSAGLTQGDGVPRDEARTAAALVALRPAGRDLVLRLNRLFWADGTAAITRFAADVDRYAALGLPSQVQVRYHPPEGHEGDIPGWTAFVREAVRVLGARPSVVAFDITNEANFPVSPNTSDGAYDGVVAAIVAGVQAAREELDALGRPDVQLGFNVAWRWLPNADARFWSDVGAAATPAFRRALDYVGVQVYPGLVWPPVALPGRTAGQEVVEALTLLRTCFMPRAGLGAEVALWVTENGYATNLGRTEPAQAADLDTTVRDVHRWSATLGVTDYRYFNLRDNDSDGTDLFAAVGLVRDDETPKPAFATYRELVATLGTTPPRAAPRLLRRCLPGGRLRVAVHGPGVRSATFLLGARHLRRRAPFTLVLGPRTLARTRAHHVRARVQVDDGRIVGLRRTLPRCGRATGAA